MFSGNSALGAGVEIEKLSLETVSVRDAVMDSAVTDSVSAPAMAAVNVTCASPSVPVVSDAAESVFPADDETSTVSPAIPVPVESVNTTL